MRKLELIGQRRVERLAAEQAAHVVMANEVALDESRQTQLFQSIEDGPAVMVPAEHLGLGTGPDLVVPSVDLVTPRGNRALLGFLYQAHPDLELLFERTLKAKKGMQARVANMTLEAMVRILDTNGADGLHHIHGSSLPHTVYSLVKRGNGLKPNVFVTQIGETEAGISVWGLLSATRDHGSEYDLFKVIGAGKQKARYNH